MSRQQKLQADIDREVNQKTSDLIMLTEGQLFTLGIQCSSLDHSSIAWILRAQKGTLEKFQVLLPKASHETSLGLVALSRNLFENLVWLKLFNADPCYGIAFYQDLLNQQEQSHNQAINQARKEIAWFRELDKDDDLDLVAVDELIERLDSLTEEEQSLLNSKMHSTSAALDERADRQFSVYGEQAKSNGYGFQAHLIEKQVLPHHEQRLGTIRRHRTELEAALPSLLTSAQIDMISQRWNWKKKACEVGMLDQYEFVYSFTSKLLHSGGINLITEKELSAGERDILLNYVRVANVHAHDEIERFTYPGQLLVRAVST